MLRELSKVEQRYDAVLAVIGEGTRVTEVAEKFGVHRDTVHSLRPVARPEALEGLRERSQPRPHASRRPAVIEARVLELWRNRPIGVQRACGTSWPEKVWRGSSAHSEVHLSKNDPTPE